MLRCILTAVSVAWFLLSRAVYAQFFTTTPPAYPLAVRSPYLSAWLPQGNGTALNGAWPSFWDGSTLGWAGYVRVDNVPYVIMGLPSISAKKATAQNAQFSSTQSVFNLTAGGVTITALFLNPVQTDNLTLQSLPFSYYSFSASSNDGGSHSVEVYTDISAEWVASTDSLNVTWSTSASSSIVTHQTQLQDQQLFGESEDRILYGSMYISTANDTGLSWQSGQDVLLRQQFVNYGYLNNTQDKNFRSINTSWPVFAFAKDLGNVTQDSSASVVFTLGHVRDPQVQFIVSDGQMQNRSAYFWSSFSTIDDAIESHYNNYTDALSASRSFDNQLYSDSTGVSSEYAHITALSVVQALAGSEITISKTSSGEWNTSDILVFTRDLGAPGSLPACVVDVLYPSWPIYLYTNPDLGAYALRPLLVYQATSGLYTEQFAAHDLGSAYPNATGNDASNGIQMPVEESGNMIIMLYSHYLKTQDKTYITQYYTLIKQWAEYLASNTPYPPLQSTTDIFEKPLANMTNLAIKGAIGLGAMSKIASVVGQTSDATNYTSLASSYASQIVQQATSSDDSHLNLVYGNDETWGTMYNLFADKLLQLNLFNDSVYQMQDNWYSEVKSGFGVPLDSRNSYALTDWEVFAAATATSQSTRDSAFLNPIFLYLSDQKYSAPLCDMYDTGTGDDMNKMFGRMTVGSHLALLVVNSTSTSNSSGPTSTSTTSATASVSTPSSTHTSDAISIAPFTPNLFVVATLAPLVLSFIWTLA